VRAIDLALSSPETLFYRATKSRTQPNPGDPRMDAIKPGFGGCDGLHTEGRRKTKPNKNRSAHGIRGNHGTPGPRLRAKPDPLQNENHPRHDSRPPPNFQPAPLGQALRRLARFVCLRVHSWLPTSGALGEHIPTPRTRDAVRLGRATRDGLHPSGLELARDAAVGLRFGRNDLRPHVELVALEDILGPSTGNLG
jgi:hypothetical protein